MDDRMFVDVVSMNYRRNEGVQGEGAAVLA